MHAFLVTGHELDVEDQIQKILAREHAQRQDISIQTIAQVREMIHINSIHHVAVTAYIIKDIHESSIESQNAILKILEEPQKNIIFILTTIREDGLLPTIISRCQVITTKSTKEIGESKEALAFVALSQGQKLLEITKIKTRDQALAFLDSLAKSAHNSLTDGHDMSLLSKNTLLTTNAIKKNANIQIQLTKFILS